MSEENVVSTTEKPRRKLPRWPLAVIVCGLIITLTICPPFPLNTMPVSGTVVILDENGDAIPFQPTRGTFFSHYAPDIFRGNWNRKRRVTANRSGDFNIRTPEFNGTLVLLTKDEKHAAIVDIRSDEPTTGLVAELRPTHSVKGRLLDREGNPFANEAFSLVLYAHADIGSRLLSVWIDNRRGGTLIGEGAMYGLHSVDAITDSEGYFTADRLIPGGKYTVNDSHLPSRFVMSTRVEIPFLLPEQYQEPYDLGDIVGQIVVWQRRPER